MTAPSPALRAEPYPVAAAPRLVSLDAYRGFVMLLMMAEVLRFASVARAVPDSAFWAFFAHHQTHVEWIGCSLHDLIQPSFSFIVGVALPFSIASRLARGQARVRLASGCCCSGCIGERFSCASDGCSAAIDLPARLP